MKEGGINMPQEKKVNRVNVDQLFSTITVIKEKREIAQFKFRATNQWIAGTHSRTAVGPFGALKEDTPRQPMVIEEALELYYKLFPKDVVDFIVLLSSDRSEDLST